MRGLLPLSFIHRLSSRDSRDTLFAPTALVALVARKQP